MSSLLCNWMDNNAGVKVKMWHKLHELRKKYVDKYSWAIPSYEAIQEISKHGPIVEMGAGTGYWAKLLTEEDVKVVAFDKIPETEQHFNVQTGEPSVLRCYSNYSLFLCWPPYNDPMSDECLDSYRGQTVIYIGEGCGGCTGSDLFHQNLCDNFDNVKYVDIPQWDGMHDYLSIWKRIS